MQVSDTNLLSLSLSLSLSLFYLNSLCLSFSFLLSLPFTFFLLSSPFPTFLCCTSSPPLPSLSSFPAYVCIFHLFLSIFQSPLCQSLSPLTRPQPQWLIKINFWKWIRIISNKSWLSLFSLNKSFKDGENELNSILFYALEI